jgi:hypothetical protein
MDKKKIIIWGGAILIGGYLVYKYLKGSGSSGGGGGLGLPSGLLSSNQINKIATDLFDAMDGYGTDEDTINSSFEKIKTDADFDAVVKAFGTRTISSGRGNIFQGDYNGDLIGALKSELSSTEIEELNSILQKNKINRTI